MSWWLYSDGPQHCPELINRPCLRRTRVVKPKDRSGDRDHGGGGRSIMIVREWVQVVPRIIMWLHAGKARQADKWTIHMPALCRRCCKR
jgi:hypothetical protein